MQPDLSELSLRELEQQALMYARQGNPVQAQRILDCLGQASEKASNGDGGNDCTSLRPSQGELANVRASVVDAWFEYQKRQMKILEE